MSNYYMNTTQKMREIFKDHCNLTLEEYEEISGQLIYLISDIQEAEPMAEIEKRINYIKAATEFMYNVKDLTLAEYTGLTGMVDEIWENAQKEAAKAAMEEGTVL